MSYQMEEARTSILECRAEAESAEDYAEQATSAAQEAVRACTKAISDLEEVEIDIEKWEALGDFDDIENTLTEGYKEVFDLKVELEEARAELAVNKVGGGEALKDTNNALKASLEANVTLRETIELLMAVNKEQSTRIKGARVALMTNEDTGLTKSQEDYMEYPRKGEPQDVVLERGVNLNVDEVVDAECGGCGTCDPVGWDANGSPVS